MITIEENDVRFFIKETENGRNGLFAQTEISKNDLLHVKGIYIRCGSTVDNCTRYLDPIKFKTKYNEEIKGYEFAVIPFGYCSMVRNIDDPKQANVELINPIEHCPDMAFRFKRNIVANEEILVCYGHNSSPNEDDDDQYYDEDDYEDDDYEEDEHQDEYEEYEE